jgi:CHAT domain-containing protein/Tfp pilus assembly protein PilF
MMAITVAILLALASAPRAQEPADRPLLEVQGELTRADPVDPVLKKGFHKVYPVKLAAGAYYQIDLVSKDFDAYLRLEDAGGKSLAQDDDTGGEQNARIVYQAAKAEVCRVVVTTFDAAAVGAFRLTVTPTDQAAAERHKLVQAAQALYQTGAQLNRQGKQSDAVPRLRQALELFRRAYPKENFPRGHLDLAESLNDLGFVLMMQAKFDQAEPLLREALAMRQRLYPREEFPAGHPYLARSYNLLGGLFNEQGDYAGAEPFFRQALAMRQALYPREKYPRGHVEVARSLDNVGVVLLDQGEYAKAEPILRDALAMYEALYPREQHPRGHPDLAGSLYNLGLLLRRQGDHGKAEPLLRQALAMERQLFPKGHARLAASIDQLGRLLLDEGEYARAEPLLREALTMRQQLFPKARYPAGHVSLATSLSSLGSLYTDQREYAKAEAVEREALAMHRALYPRAKYPVGHRNLAAAIANLAGTVEAQGAYAEAEPLFQQALAMDRALYPPERYPDGHRDLAMTINNVARLYWAQGKYDQAEPLYRESLAMRQRLFPWEHYPDGHRLLATGLNSLGMLQLAKGEYAQAEPLLRQALEVYTRLNNRLAQVAPEAVALNAAYTFPRSRDALLTAAGELPGADGRTYAALWQSRAALTRVYQRRHLSLIAAAGDPSIRDAWDHVQTLRRQREQLIMAPMPKDPAGRADKLRLLQREIADAELALLPRLPALKYYEDQARIGPDALRKLLPADAVLIDLLRYTHFSYDRARPGAQGERRTVRYVAFVVHRKDVRRVELGSAGPIDRAVREWRAAITATVPGGNATARQEHEAKLAHHAAGLRRLLWEPLEKQLPAATAAVYLVPDAELTQLPWAALPGKGKDRVLLDDYALAVLPHGPFLLEQLTPPPPRSAKRPPAPEGLLLVGGIRYDDEPARLAVASRAADAVVGQKVVWHYLGGTEAERDLIAKLLPSGGPKLTASLGGGVTTTGRMRQELERCRYAHIATHGFFADAQFRSVLQLDPKLFEQVAVRIGDRLVLGQRIGEGARNPLVLSGLVCAGANRPDTPERGILSADAIAGLLLDDLHLAVLSACDTGIGDVAGGEGVFGLQRAFHIAGCKNVVASLWKVPDRPTAALMALFYQNLWDKKLPPIEALRQAQLEIFRHPERIGTLTAELRGTFTEVAGSGVELPTALGGTAHPRIWAAFTLSGLGQ